MEIELKSCQRCGTPRRWLHGHHTKPRVEGGTYNDGREDICANCHEDEHGGPFGGVLRGRLGNSPAARKKKSERMKEHWRDPEKRATWIEKRRAEGRKRSKRPPKKKLLAMRQEGKTEREIGELCGVAQGTVSIWLQELEIETRVGRRPGESPWTGEEMLCLVDEAGSISEAARRSGMPLSTFRYWMRRLEIEWEPSAGPTREKVAEALQQGGDVTKGARFLGVPRSTFAGWVEKFELELPNLKPSRAEIERAYEQSEFRIGKTALLLGVSYSTANRWLNEEKIERRGRPGRPKEET